MTQSRSFLTALAIGTALLFAGDAPHVPAQVDHHAAVVEATQHKLSMREIIDLAVKHDDEIIALWAEMPEYATLRQVVEEWLRRQGSATDAEPAPTDDLAEPAPQPELVYPSAPVPAGEFIDVSVRAAVPPGVTPTLQWKLDGKPADAKHARIAQDGLSAVLALPLGKHAITVRGAWGVIVEGQVAITFVDLEGVIEVIGAQPPPDPDDPDPPEPPVVEGKRTVVILHESADQTAAQARLFTALRTGTAAQYITQKGHNLLILDDDAVDQAGRPLALITKLLALGTAPPFIAILDTNTGAVLHQRALSPAANAEGVLAVLKEHGG